MHSRPGSKRSTNRFTTIGGASHLFLLLAGYAVLDDATMR
jgi:hypothetical protein